MNKKRFEQLISSPFGKLTKQEVKDGWHFCCEWDGMLIHSSHPEAECCYCFREAGFTYDLEKMKKAVNSEFFQIPHGLKGKDLKNFILKRK